MAIELVNIGASPNDGEGDPLRTAFAKINNNFIWMQQTATNITSTITLDDAPNQIIFEYPTDSFTQAIFQIKSYNEDNNDSQDIFIQAQLSNDLNQVKFTGYGTSFFGNNVCTYDMSVNTGNVRITVSPFSNVVLQHFIAYQVTWTGDLGVGMALTTESSEGIITEFANAIITTEST